MIRFKGGGMELFARKGIIGGVGGVGICDNGKIARIFFL